MSKLITAGLILLMVSACTVGPDYFRPQVTVPASWNVSYDAAAGFADYAWWRQFNDPVIDDLVSIALMNNLDLKVAVARVDRYLGQLRTTRSEFFPQIGVSANATRLDDTDTGMVPSGGPYNYYQGAFVASWEIDLWGRVRRLNEAAQAELLASEAGRRGILLSLVSNVVSNYLILRGFDRQLEISRETEHAYAESLRIFRLRHKHGTVSAVEVSQVESEYEDAAQAIPELETRVAQQEHLLSVLLGQNPGSISRGKPIDELVAPDIPAGLPADLLEQRPDIIRAEESLIAANARIGVARALYFPRIALTGAFGTASINSGDLFDGASQTWQVGGNLLGPVFTFGAIEGQVLASEAAQREALYRYQQTIISAFRDVEDALVATTKGRKRQTAQERRTRALEKYVRLATYQYDAGTAGYLQVLDANRSLFSSQLDHVQTQTTAFTSLIDVYRALGGGWVDEADRISQPTTPEEDAAEAESAEEG